MIHSPLRAALENGDARTIQSTIQNVNRSPKDVINILCDIFDTAVSSHWELESSSHPIITVNSVKNIISDNKVNPSIPLLLFDFESKFKKGDNIIFASFGAGFTWGAMYLKWAYNH